MKRSLRLLMAGAALWYPGLAFAQSAAQPEPADQRTSGDASTQIDDIIVTAQKRTERLQDVPLTLTVVTGETLDRQTIRNITDLQNATPELNYTGQPSAGYSIRGSGTQTFTRSAENNVLVVVDGVVQGQLTPPTTSLFDIARVEVLGGPQGMLFGKNASAGVVNIITTEPVLGEFSGRGRAIYGSNDLFTASAVLNAPIGETAALRLTAIHDEAGARIFNKFNNSDVDARDADAVRGRLRWEATPTLSLGLIADYERERGGNSVWVARSAIAGSATSIAGRLAACGVVPGPENTDVCIDGPSSRRIVSSGASMQIDADLGAATLTNIVAYRRYERNSDTDSDTRPINALNNNAAQDRIDQWSEELRIASNERQTFEYVAGLFIYDYAYGSVTDQSGTLGALPFVATRSTAEEIRQRSFALFGQSTIRITDQFNLIAGARYTWDTLDATFNNYVNPALGVRFTGFTPAAGGGSNSVDEQNFSYRIGAQFEPTPNATFFATYSRGYKGPAVNNVLAGVTSLVPRVVLPEIPTNIEAGVKAAIFDRRVNVDLSVFHTDVKDFQAQTVATSGVLSQFVFTNADELKFRGVQLNVYARPAPGVSLSGGALYNDTEYGRFVVACNAPYLTGCAATPAGQTINVEGNQLANAPRWKLNFGGSYERPLSGAVTGFVDANVVFRSGAPTSATPDPNLYIDSYTFIDGRIGLKSSDGGWTVSAFVRNLFDERAPTIIFRDPLSPVENYMQNYAGNSFRTVGISLEASF